MESKTGQTALLDLEPSKEIFLEEVLEGLRNQSKSLPCKYFYDERGSKLFDRICELDEYYVTRTELRIMKDHVSDMANHIGEGVRLVEYGSGSSLKTRILLSHLKDPVAYVPVDISRDYLEEVGEDLAEAYPNIEILPVCADFTESFDLPEPTREPTHTAVYFPGSTIGNFTPTQARNILGGIAPLCGDQGGLVIGVDLQKDPEVLEAAYDDSEGVTAEFNLNLIRRIKHELDGSIEAEDFQHHARYNEAEGRIEISLRSLRDQTVTIGGESFEFEEGEMIHTEYSHKYTIEGFEEMAGEAGLSLHGAWTDPRKYFAVLHFVVPN
ncbi:MAG: L-histidine N(alpha)-methyltransferase [Candidatus Omnitrophica bacterium]|nr:L-histidine N(alpha)-methyltransferase [Candidatus Omnitrophota bacterium]MCA9445165.1 L-histidine N(alpha)-methyltransferase [Candidatus Omnitrophota bacterium]